jgi:hypothetical protein
MSLSMSAFWQGILARLMPPAQAEALIGDLLEERRLRLQAETHVSAAGWYSRQLASSVSVLLWASLRRGAWLVTVVTAVASLIAALRIMAVIQSALRPISMTSSVAEGVIFLLSLAVALAACGSVAASIRLGAARLLAFLVFAARCAMLVNSTELAPLWYEALLFVLGPLATIAGAALSGRWRTRRPSSKLPSKG